MKKLTGKPTITVGSLGLDRIFDGGREPVKATEAHFETLIAMFERGDFDLVAVGRALLSNPDWVNKVRAGESPRCGPMIRATGGAVLAFRLWRDRYRDALALAAGA